MAHFDNKEGKQEREDVFSKSVRAGKRTYFFDVKATKRNDYYLTITESKKHYDEDGKFHFEKHKLFLYKEDFEKFSEGFAEVLEYIKQNQPELKGRGEMAVNEFSNVSFDDLNG